MPVDHNTLTAMLRESLAQGRPVWLTVTSGSMRPLLHEGDQIQVVPTTPDTLTSGDIIVIDDGRTLLTHRLRTIKTDNNQIYLHTRGDRLIHDDPPVPAAALLGRVTARQRDGQTLAFATTEGQRLHQRLNRLATVEERWLGRFGSRTTPPPTFLQRVIHFVCGQIGRFYTFFS